MYRVTSLIVVLFPLILPAVQAQAKSDNNAAVNNKSGAPTIAVTKLDISDKALRLDYEIRNDSQQDVWLCDKVSKGRNFEVYLDEDAQTLVVRKRLNVPSLAFFHVQPSGKFIRLCPGQQRVESLLLTVPVNSDHMYYSSRKRLQGIVNAKRLSIEIGYYVGDLPEIFFDMLRETEKTELDKMLLFEIWFYGTLGFNKQNEALRQRDEEVLIPYTQQRLNGEQVLRTMIDGLSVPYRETETRIRPKYNPPDLTTCTRVEIQYQPSMLEYFYQYQTQQDLLNREEMEHLASEKTIVIEDAKDISDLANEVKQAERAAGGIVSEKSKADVLCYDGSRRVTSFIVYDDTSIETEQQQRIKYDNGLQSLKKLTPQIQPFELRMWCAANLKNLWHRLLFYDRAEKSRVQSYSNIRLKVPNELDDPKRNDLGLEFYEKLEEEMRSVFESDERRFKDLYSSVNLVYPEPRRWCDTMEWAFVGPAIRSRRDEVESKMKVHLCPSVGEGRSTYAMNPKCKPDSPPDMVLLFETKSGWNQHGGPELFTCDNHDPRGGCVLLNDGTVKFIRTKEELRQLRWK